MTDLSGLVSDQPVVLDGGLATQLERQGVDVSGPLWSARALRDHPEAVTAAHRAFFEAGSSVATTATYQATFEGFRSLGVADRETTDLMVRAVHLARLAADEVSDRPTYVAASVGPYGAMLADGSEYRGDYGLSVRQLRSFHRPRLEVLATTGADVLALETIPCAAEVEALLLELEFAEIPAWLSLTVSGERTRSGEALADVFAMTKDAASVFAVGVNCSTPSDATVAVGRAATSSEKPVVVYPNSGEAWDATRRDWDGADAFDVGLATQWVSDGARLVGGCCRVTPEQIAGVATQVTRLHR